MLKLVQTLQWIVVLLVQQLSEKELKLITLYKLPIIVKLVKIQLLQHSPDWPVQQTLGKTADWADRLDLQGI